MPANNLNNYAQWVPIGEFRTYLERAMSQRMQHHKSQGSPSYGAWASVSYRQVEGPLSLSLSLQ